MIPSISRSPCYRATASESHPLGTNDSRARNKQTRPAYRAAPTPQHLGRYDLQPDPGTVILELVLPELANQLADSIKVQNNMLSATPFPKFNQERGSNDCSHLTRTRNPGHTIAEA